MLGLTFSLAELLNVFGGGVLGGTITAYFADRYYKRSMSPEHYLNRVLNDVSERHQRMALEIYSEDDRGESERQFDSPQSDDLYSPLFQVVGYADTGYGDVACLKLTPIGVLAALYYKKRIELEE